MEVIEEKIATLAVEERRAQLLTTMTGVGYFTEMLILSEVGDVNRFCSDKAFTSVMGLAPSVHQSGERTRISGVSGPVTRGYVLGANPHNIQLTTRTRIKHKKVNT